MKVDGFGGLGLFPEVVVPESEPTSAVVAFLVVIANHQGPVFRAQFLESCVDGTAVDVGENDG
jgi:hypothetical protein